MNDWKQFRSPYEEVKINVNGTKQALTPIGLVGPVDQHSFLQLITEGKRDKTVTFVKINDFENHTAIPSKTLTGFDDLDYVDGLTFAELIEEQGLKEKALLQLQGREIFSDQLLGLISKAENENGLSQSDSKRFIDLAVDVFRWHNDALVGLDFYQQLKTEHPLIADIASE